MTTMRAELDWAITKADGRIIRAIIGRAVQMAILCDDTMSSTMDLEATHLNGCPLRLADLLAADDFNFAHDVCGIQRHIDRETGQLRDCFVPRFSARRAER